MRPATSGFQRERRVGRYVFTNEIEASRIRKLP